MSRAQLRIYNGPTEETPTIPITDNRHLPRKVSVPLSEVLPLLVDAVQSERTWLRDFGEEEMIISTDLYEVILAYQYYRRPSA